MKQPLLIKWNDNIDPYTIPDHIIAFEYARRNTTKFKKKQMKEFQEKQNRILECLETGENPYNVT